ncbi:uncharacterized protein LOC131855116 [Achroia grisella]|uniref:uncharacterized protein LOC131855116 n=1 Tax=Achroia grisella TaxID=688607 RepID=UPI0027D25269|nr:uncharacterized protein LOC131855116 [Achroia grisella]
MAKQDDGLFLLEVLIDKIVFVKSPCFSDKDFRTCVNIECPSVEPLEICDDDPSACIVKSGGPFVKTFNNGKSCLFSMKASDIDHAIGKFPIKVSVYKSLPCGCLPTKIIIGEATIDMTKEFVQARKKFLDDPTNVSYQALKDSFRIIGTDGAETGEIVMFLRISCFGKLIITRFQGGGVPPNLTSRGSSAVIDRSCTLRKDFQTSQNPCICGIARESNSGGVGINRQPCTIDGGGFGICPPARNPYNSMPCEDPDDPCYCSGSVKSAGKQQMICKNTDQYCLHVPKGKLPSLPFHQEITEDQKQDLKAMSKTLDNQIKIEEFLMLTNKLSKKPTATTVSDYLKMSVESMNFLSNTCETNLSSSETCSVTSLYTLHSKRRSVSFSNTVNCISKSHQSFSCPLKDDDSKHKYYFEKDYFGEKETTVYMTLFDDYLCHRTSGTQATASVNKCLQVSHKNRIDIRPSTNTTNSNLCSTCTLPTIPNGNKILHSNRHDSEVFFFEWNKHPESNKSGLGSSGLKTKLKRISKATVAPVRSEKHTIRETASIQAQSSNSSTAVQTKKARGSSAGTSTGKLVSIRDSKMEKPCLAVGGVTKGDMMATVSHIRIGPKEQCPIHGTEPCLGPKYIIASSEEEQAPVKITTMTNPRRGVFELIIRRITGAPLAKNELMLEWTPPPSRPPSCRSPCHIVSYSPPRTYRSSKCKMIVRHPSSCRPRHYKKGYKKPNGLVPCRYVPCKKCWKPSCCKKYCRPSKTCSPLPRCKPSPPLPICRTCAPIYYCKPCSPSPCSKPCPPSPCRPCSPSLCYGSCSPSPCKSSPCLRPCHVGRKRPRKTRSHPKIKAHSKRKSPCRNRSKTCPMVRCRSMPGPCNGCYVACPPRKSYSVSPCKPIKCCKSISSASCCCE